MRITSVLDGNQIFEHIERKDNKMWESNTIVIIKYEISHFNVKNYTEIYNFMKSFHLLLKFRVNRRHNKYSVSAASLSSLI